MLPSESETEGGLFPAHVCDFMILSGEKVSKYVKAPPEIKINPNGVDVKVSEVWKIDDNTVSVLNGKVRETNPQKKLMEPDDQGFYNLVNGIYEVRIANEVEIPNKFTGMLLPRSSLNRLGMIKSESALWDSGYKGFGTQTIFIPIKLFKIHKNDFWFQFILLSSEESKNLYDGHWQNEKPKFK